MLDASDVPAVSVIVPVYNGERYLPATIDSVLRQTFPDWELVIVDDGSTDRSLETVQRLTDGCGHPVSIHRQSRGGQSAARNAAAGYARGEFLAFLDQDDIWRPDKLERQVGILRADPETVFVHSDVDYIDEEGRTVRHAVTSSARERCAAYPICRIVDLDACFVLPSAMLIRTRAYREAGGFDPALIRDEDTDLAWRLSLLGRVRFDPTVATGYRLHPHNFSKSSDEAGFLGDKGAGSNEQFYLKLLRHYTNDPEKAPRIRKLLGQCYSVWGKEKVRSGRRAEGRRLLLRSLRYDPCRLRSYSRLVRSYLPFWIGS